jgi:hypothetical protein
MNTETYFCLRDIGTAGNRFKLRKVYASGGDITTLNFTVEGGTGVDYSSATRDDIDEGEWHYIAIVSTNLSSRQIHHAKTGAAVLTSETANTTTYSNTNLWDEIQLGQKQEGGGASGLEMMTGQIDEFKMYSRALTAAELLKNYKGSKKRHKLRS